MAPEPGTLLGADSGGVIWAASVGRLMLYKRAVFNLGSDISQTGWMGKKG